MDLLLHAAATEGGDYVDLRRRNGTIPIEEEKIRRRRAIPLIDGGR